MLFYIAYLDTRNCRKVIFFLTVSGHNNGYLMILKNLRLNNTFWINVTNKVVKMYKY